MINRKDEKIIYKEEKIEIIKHTKNDRKEFDDKQSKVDNKMDDS